MVDKKTKFVLSLQGKINKGHMEHWSIVDGELVGLVDNIYTLAARNWGYDLHDDYVVSAGNYYTLGEQCEHGVLLRFLVEPEYGWD